jgi:hypothetical protein
MLFDAHGEIPSTVKTTIRNAAKIADARQGERHQLIQKVPHTLPAQGDTATNRHSFTQLISRDGFFGPGDDGLLSGDLGQFRNGILDQLVVLRSFTKPMFRLML